MRSKNIILLKTLWQSTSQINILRHSKDKSKRGKVIGNLVGMAVLYIMLMAFCIATCIGYGEMGIISEAPVLCALTISVLALILTLFKTNGYLFNFKEYDMLMALPFEAKTVAACKFLYMYLNSLPWYLCISVAMLVGYAVYEKPAVLVYPIWIVLALILPIIPMLAAAFIGFLIAKVSSGFKKKNIVQTLLLIAITMVAIFSRFFIESMFRNGKVEEVLTNYSALTDRASDYYPPAKWFANAVNNASWLDFLLLVGVSAILFELIFIAVGRSYRKLNSSFKSHAAGRKYRMGAQRQRGVLNAIAFKEFKRMTGSSTYMVNAIIGDIILLIGGIIVLFINVDDLIKTITYDSPLTKEMICPAIPLIAYFMSGMVATTACTPSLEGKNYWILQSLPITKKDIYRGKMLFNMYLEVPFTVFGIICFSISARASFISTVLYLIFGLALCMFSTAWGCVCGVKHIKLEWENEVEVVKQGTALTLYLLPNMFVTMILIGLIVFLGTKMSGDLVVIILTVIALALALLSYMRVMKLAEKNRY